MRALGFGRCVGACGGVCLGLSKLAEVAMLVLGQNMDTLTQKAQTEAIKALCVQISSNGEATAADNR